MKYILFVAILLIACSPSKKSTADHKAEVMKIHDDSMEKMGEIRQAAFSLEDLAKTHMDSTAILKIVSELEAADEGMMEWMANYKEPEEKDMESFLAAEKVKIQEVANNIYKSLENAQKYIDK